MTKIGYPVYVLQTNAGYRQSLSFFLILSKNYTKEHKEKSMLYFRNMVQ